MPGLDVQDWCFLELGLFRKQMEYLKNYFQVLPLAAAIERLRMGDITTPVAAITFDDGYQNNFDLAFPVLREFGLPAVIFLCTDLVDSDESIWFCRLIEALAKTRMESLEWNGRTYAIQGRQLKARAASALQAELKKLEPDRLVAAMHEISRRLQYDYRRSDRR